MYEFDDFNSPLLIDQEEDKLKDNNIYDFNESKPNNTIISWPQLLYYPQAHNLLPLNEMNTINVYNPHNELIPFRNYDQGIDVHEDVWNAMKISGLTHTPSVYSNIINPGETESNGNIIATYLHITLLFVSLAAVKVYWGLMKSFEHIKCGNQTSNVVYMQLFNKNFCFGIFFYSLLVISMSIQKYFKIIMVGSLLIAIGNAFLLMRWIYLSPNTQNDYLIFSMNEKRIGILFFAGSGMMGVGCACILINSWIQLLKSSRDANRKPILIIYVFLDVLCYYFGYIWRDYSIEDDLSFISPHHFEHKILLTFVLTTPLFIILAAFHFLAWIGSIRNLPKHAITVCESLTASEKIIKCFHLILEVLNQICKLFRPSVLISVLGCAFTDYLISNYLPHLAICANIILGNLINHSRILYFPITTAFELISIFIGFLISRICLKKIYLFTNIIYLIITISHLIQCKYDTLNPKISVGSSKNESLKFANFVKNHTNLTLNHTTGFVTTQILSENETGGLWHEINHKFVFSKVSVIPFFIVIKILIYSTLFEAILIQIKNENFGVPENVEYDKCKALQLIIFFILNNIDFRNKLFNFTFSINNIIKNSTDSERITHRNDTDINLNYFHRIDPHHFTANIIIIFVIYTICHVLIKINWNFLRFKNNL